MTSADVQALEALGDRWRADAEASDDTLESRAFLACAKDLDMLLHGAGRDSAPCYCCSQGCDPACRCWAHGAGH